MNECYIYKIFNLTILFVFNTIVCIIKLSSFTEEMII